MSLIRDCIVHGKRHVCVFTKRIDAAEEKDRGEADYDSVVRSYTTPESVLLIPCSFCSRPVVEGERCFNCGEPAMKEKK